MDKMPIFIILILNPIDNSLKKSISTTKEKVQPTGFKLLEPKFKKLDLVSVEVKKVQMFLPKEFLYFSTPLADYLKNSLTLSFTIP